MSINLQNLEDGIDKKYKESSLLSKLAKHYSPVALCAGAVITAIAAPFLGLGYYSVKHSYEKKVKQEAMQESLRFKEGCLQELSEQKKVLDDNLTRLNKDREAVYQKERDLDFRKMEVDSAARIAEFDDKYFKIKEQIIEAKQEILTNQLDKREQALQEAEQKLEKMMFNHAKESLFFYK